jgi:hypothetical protein
VDHGNGFIVGLEPSEGSLLAVRTGVLAAVPEIRCSCIDGESSRSYWTRFMAAAGPARRAGT